MCKKRLPTLSKRVTTKSAPKSKAPKVPRTYSQDSRAITMRDYRARKRAGLVVSKKYPPELVEEAADLRGQGLTYREIGDQLGVDYAGISRAIRRKVKESNPEE